jgi:hypothetical protein
MNQIIKLFPILFLLGCTNQTSTNENEQPYDVVIYGSTPAGIAAAVTAGRNGKTAVIIDPHQRIGGMPASGMSNTDFRTFEAFSGIWKEFTDSVAQHYKNTFGEDSPEYRDSWRGANYAPKVALRIFTNMINDAGVQTMTGYLLEETLMQNGSINAIKVKNLGNDQMEEISGTIFIDASYEGDLMAMAGEDYVLGAESRAKYNESLAPEKSNPHVMAYNFRVAVTKDPNNRIEFYPPEGYDSTAYPILLKGFKSGRFKKLQDVIQILEIPNHKANLNDRHSSDTESFMLYNETDRWPEATFAERQELKALAEFKAKSYFYFLSNDLRVPANVREEMLLWGYPKDEFVDNNHFPPWLYVREGRRMLGEYVFTQHDGRPAPGSVRAPAQEDGIAIGDFGFNSHGSHLDSAGHKTGMIKGEPTVPYQVPYRSILPKKTKNLLVPVALSASRVGYATIRMEPVWTSLGEAAGMAAVVALGNEKVPHDIDIVVLQTRLHEAGAKTFYTSDVPPSSPYFYAVQFLGNRGFFQHLYPDSLQARVGEHIVKYTWQAFIYHDVMPEALLDEELKNEWVKLVEENFGAKMKKKAAEIASRVKTRGEFLQEVCEEMML